MVDFHEIPNTESSQVEFKQELTDALEKTVVAFLNSPFGGVIYFGVAGDGTIYGISNSDDLQLKIGGRLRDNILPSCREFFRLETIKEKDKTIIALIIESGLETPYYISKYGMSLRGCFVRIGDCL